MVELSSGDGFGDGGEDGGGVPFGGAWAGADLVADVPQELGDSEGLGRVGAADSWSSNIWRPDPEATISRIGYVTSGSAHVACACCICTRRPGYR